MSAQVFQYGLRIIERVLYKWKRDIANKFYRVNYK